MKFTKRDLRHHYHTDVQTATHQVTTSGHISSIDIQPTVFDTTITVE